MNVIDRKLNITLFSPIIIGIIVVKMKYTVYYIKFIIDEVKLYPVIITYLVIFLLL